MKFAIRIAKKFDDTSGEYDDLGEADTRSAARELLEAELERRYPGQWERADLGLYHRKVRFGGWVLAQISSVLSPGEIAQRRIREINDQIEDLEDERRRQEEIVDAEIEAIR